jgi:hypothetical protein
MFRVRNTVRSLGLMNIVATDLSFSNDNKMKLGSWGLNVWSPSIIVRSTLLILSQACYVRAGVAHQVRLRLLPIES